MHEAGTHMKHAVRTATAVTLASFCLCSAAGAKVVTFNVAGAQAVSPGPMNDKGQLAGSYLDAAGTHGFLRQPDGTITTFDVPGGHDVAPVAISRTGVITGHVAIGDLGRGFVRGVNGAITTFKVPGGRITTPAAGNADDWSVGFYTRVPNNLADQAFLRGPHHQTLEFAVPGATETVAEAVNASLTIAGEAIGQGGGTSQGFIRTPDGAIAQFGQDTGYTLIEGINDDGTIVGQFTDPQSLAFVRTIDGTLTTFTGPDGATPAFPTSINNSGTIVGGFRDSNGNLHGFFRTADGTATPFDIEGATGTIIGAINNKGAIAGQYTDQDGTLLGFAGKP